MPANGGAGHSHHGGANATANTGSDKPTGQHDDNEKGESHEH